MLALALGFAATGCRLAPAHVHNLRELHVDGTHRRRADLKSPVEYLISGTLRGTNFGGEGFATAAASPERVSDPNRECFANVLDLAKCARDERVAGLQAAALAEVATSCPYPLSRERALLALGELAPLLALQEAPPEPAGMPATPERTKELFDRLVATLREVLVAPGLAGSSLAGVESEIGAEPLDLAGALRLLRACNELLADGEQGAVLAPLRALRLALARRCVRAALSAGLLDRQGRVVAAALEANLRAFPGERRTRLQWALEGSIEGVEEREAISLRALEWLARLGPPPEAGSDPEVERRAWQARLTEVLRRAPDGPHSVAACRALARVTGEKKSLRPEVWLGRWREHSSATEAIP